MVFPSIDYSQYSLVLCQAVTALVKRLPCSGGRAHPFDYGKDCTHGFDAVIHTSLRACTISSPDKN